MSIKYSKIKKYPTIFNRLFGLSVSEFDRLFSQVEPLWIKQVVDHYKRPGRKYALELSDMILMLLLYYRTYTTQIFVGFLFGIDDSRVCRNIQKLEPILARVMAVKKTKHLSKEEVAELIIDATRNLKGEEYTKRLKESLRVLEPCGDVREGYNMQGGRTLTPIYLIKGQANSVKTC